MPVPKPSISRSVAKPITLVLAAACVSLTVVHARPQPATEAPDAVETEARSHYVRAIFNDLKPGPLAGQQGGEGFAADSAWSVQGPLTLQSGDLQLPESNGRAYIRSQNATPLSLGAGGKTPGEAVRKLAVPMKGQVWFSYLVNLQSASDKAGIRLLQEESALSGYEITATGADLSIQDAGSAESKTCKDVIPPGKTSLVLGRVDLDPDQTGKRSLSVWVNPDVEKLGEPLFQQPLPDDAKAITHLGFITAGGATGAPRSMLDEAILSNYPYPSGYYNVAPRKRHFGKWHIPVKPADTTTRLPPPGYKLVFSDEFDANELDQAKWNYRLGDKADSAQEAENVEVRDGNLLVHARKQRLGKYEYTGGGVVSKPLFVYGYYEARFKIPAGEGWHTAFWTMPVYDPIELRNTEIDFCEQDSGDPHYFSLGVIDHRAKGWNNSNIGRWVIEDAPNMVDEFVVIAAEFTPDYIRFYMNGRLAKEVDSRLFPHGPATVQLSCIATKKKGDRFQDDARLPSQATFDYVRVYQNPNYAQAEASAMTRVKLPTKPLPPLIERQRSGTATGTLD